MKKTLPDFWPDGDELLADVDWLQRLATQLVGDAAGGDDLAQETWATVAAKERRPRALRPYLAGVARLLLLERRRKSGRRTEHETRFASEAQREGAVDALDTEARLDWQETVVRALRRVPEKQRQVLMLRFFDQLEPKEIAARLGMPGATVRSQLARGLAALRLELDAETPGGRAAWLAGLAPFIQVSSVSRTLTLGLGALSMKTILTACGVLLAVLATLFVTHDRGAPSLDVAASGAAAEAALDVAGGDDAHEQGPGAAREMELGASVSAGAVEAQRTEAKSSAAPGLHGRLVTPAGKPVAGRSLGLFVLSERVTTEQIYSGQVNLESLEDGVVRVGRVQTDDAGAFAFEEDPRCASAASLVIVTDVHQAERAPFAQAECMRAFDEIPGEEIVIVLSAPPSLGHVTAHVTDDVGAFVESFEVRLESIGEPLPGGPDGMKASWTGKFMFEGTRGAAEFDVPLLLQRWGSFRLVVSAVGFSGDSRTFEVDSFEREAEVFFQLGKGHVLRGRVVDAGSNPVEGAVVRTVNRVREASGSDPSSYSITTAFGKSVETGADGRFSIPILPPLGVTVDGLEVGAECASLRIEAEGFPELRLAREELDLDAGELTLRLAQGHRVSGRVLGAEDTERVFVVLFGRSFLSDDLEDVWQANTTVDEAGAFRFESVPEGTVFAAVWSGNSMISTEKRVVVAGNDASVVDFDLGEWGRVTGGLQVDLAGSYFDGQIELEALGLSVTLFVEGGDAPWAEGFHPVAKTYVQHGGSFDLPSVTSGAGFLRVGLNESWFQDFALAGLGGDIALGQLDVVIADFETHVVASGGPAPPR